MSPEAQKAHDEDGIGMIEIVVAMFLLALIALSFLPVLTQGLLASQKNSEVATASGLMATQLELARSAGSTCAAVDAFVQADPLPATIDGRTYRIERSLVGACTATAGTATVRVDVIETTSGNALATADTRLYVGGA